MSEAVKSALEDEARVLVAAVGGMARAKASPLIMKRLRELAARYEAEETLEEEWRRFLDRWRRYRRRRGAPGAHGHRIIRSILGSIEAQILTVAVVAALLIAVGELTARPRAGAPERRPAPKP